MLDKVQNPKLAFLWLAFGALGIWIIANASDLPTVIGACVLLGMSYAAEQQLTAY